MEITLGDLLAAAEVHWIRAALAANPACPPRLLAALACDEFESVKCAVGRNPSASLSLLAAMSGVDVGVSDADIMADPVLAPVLAHRNPISSNVGLAVCSNTSLPLSTIDALASSDIWQCQLAVAGNPLLSGEQVRGLCASPNWRVRRFMAGREDLPIGLLEQLSFDGDDGVRRAVAWNPATPQATKSRLAQDDVFVVRTAAHESPRTYVSDLERAFVATVMADPQMRIQMEEPVVVPAPSAATVDDLIDSFTGLDLLEMVQRAAALARDPETPFGLVVARLDDVESLSSVVVGTSPRKIAVQHPMTPDVVVTSFVQDPDSEIRLSVVRRVAPKCNDIALLALMADDDDRAVRRVFASCAPVATPDSVWWNLAADSDREVANAVLSNSAAPDLARARVALRPD